jgi:hypothetical protein
MSATQSHSMVGFATTPGRSEPASVNVGYAPAANWYMNGRGFSEDILAAGSHRALLAVGMTTRHTWEEYSLPGPKRVGRGWSGKEGEARSKKQASYGDTN